MLKSQTKMLFITSLVLFLVGVTSAYAHKEHFTKSAHSPQKSYEFRVSAMTIYKWYLSPMGAMLKGKVDFNPKTFAGYAEGLKAATRISILEGFPEKSSENEIDDSNAKSKIWTDLSDFEKRFKQLQQEAKKLASIAKSGNKKDIGLQFKKTASVCTSCHKKYKTK